MLIIEPKNSAISIGHVGDVGALARDEPLRVAAHLHDVGVPAERPEAGALAEAGDLGLVAPQHRVLGPHGREHGLAVEADPHLGIVPPQRVEIDPRRVGRFARGVWRDWRDGHGSRPPSNAENLAPRRPGQASASDRTRSDRARLLERGGGVGPARPTGSRRSGRRCAGRHGPPRRPARAACRWSPGRAPRRRAARRSGPPSPWDRRDRTSAGSVEAVTVPRVNPSAIAVSTPDGPDRPPAHGVGTTCEHHGCPTPPTTGHDRPDPGRRGRAALRAVRPDRRRRRGLPARPAAHPAGVRRHLGRPGDRRRGGPPGARAELAGAYYLKPNSPGRAAHIANAGYLVDARGGAGASAGGSSRTRSSGPRPSASTPSSSTWCSSRTRPAGSTRSSAGSRSAGSPGPSRARTPSSTGARSDLGPSARLGPTDSRSAGPSTARDRASLRCRA